MHGLINRALQCFVRDTYGARIWAEIATEAELGFVNFESLISYPDELTQRALDAACRRLNKPRDMLLEDLGTYLVSHPNLEPVRRILRFGGETFPDFLYSLDDLPDRARLAVPDLELPRLEMREHSPGTLMLRCTGNLPGFGHVLVGLCRAMADDYGALVLLDHLGTTDGEEVIAVQLLEARFAAGRDFTLSHGGL